MTNRTVLHLLEALQVLQVRLPGGGTAEARKLSFRELNIEQIGHVYEGLLDHTAIPLDAINPPRNCVRDLSDNCQITKDAMP